jgi:hypothetical protein
MRWWLWILAALAAPARARADDAWITPIDQAALHLAAYDEADRPYSVPARPRDIAGELAISCEHAEGRPCGDGLGAFGELDSRAGYGDWLSAGTRLRARLGSENYGADLDLDRAHLDARYQGFGLELGRDVFTLGPAAHTQVGWGDHAPPLDFARASYATARGGLFYLVGRLRSPQTYPGNLVTIARGELELGPVTLGGMQLLQLEGEGAPHLGPWAFLEEHFTRGDASAGPTDSSNRRVGLDASWRIAGFGGARLYYELMFEDWRRQFVDALRYDADHVVGFEAPSVLVEWQKTGFRSMEHSPRITGFTNAGRAVGSPLGPDAQALFVSLRAHSITPWVEFVHLASDKYTYDFHQPIVRTNDGLAEVRVRIGLRGTRAISAHLRLEAGALTETIFHVGFTHAERHSVGADLVLAWHP